MEKNQQDKIKMVLNYYELGDVLSFKHLTGGYANTNYKINMTTGKSYVYRICQQQTLDKIIYEVKLMQEFKKNKFPTAFIIPRKDGKYATLLDSHYIMIYEFLEGKEPEINPNTVEEIAVNLAKLNSFKDWKKFSRSNQINLGTCDRLIQNFTTSKYKYPDIFDYFIEQTEYLKKNLTEDVPQGIIHGDIFPDNTIFEWNKLIAIIDFEDACVDYLLFDIGMTINGFCFLKNQLDIGLLTCFIKSYNKVRKITETEIKLLPYYIQWASHGMLSWHLKNNLLNQDNKKQLARVNQFIERVIFLRNNEALISQITQEAVRA